MRITFVSNFINHHQIPFCDAMYALSNDFRFVATQQMSDERVGMGWKDSSEKLPYVIRAYQDKESARAAIDDCDVLLAGWIRDTSIISKRLKSGKPVFRISERLYREGQWKFISPRGLISKLKEHTLLGKYPVYLLCNGTYVASDYALIHAYKGKKYRFGYFPATRNYESVEEIIKRKPPINRINVEYAEELPLNPPVLTKEEIRIVWAGRFMPLKHPEYMVRLASDLVKLGYRFHIHMIGGGELENQLRALAEYELIDEHITFHGFMEPEDVRDIMEKCHIHIFTSNFLEGWGAVVNEGMNAALAEVVNDEVGSALYLIENGVNGLTYHMGSYEDMKDKVLGLLDNPESIEKYGRAAYATITELWSAEVAAKRLYDLALEAMNGEIISGYESGPLSVAPIVKPRFWATGKLGE